MGAARRRRGKRSRGRNGREVGVGSPPPSQGQFNRRKRRRLKPLLLFRPPIASSSSLPSSRKPNGTMLLVFSLSRRAGERGKEREAAGRRGVSLFLFAFAARSIRPSPLFASPNDGTLVPFAPFQGSSHPSFPPSFTHDQQAGDTRLHRYKERTNHGAVSVCFRVERGRRG